MTSKTVVRRYAPDSVKFTEATPSTIEEIRKGDQVKLRGDPMAEDIVFGTFESHVGTVIAVNREAGDIRIEDLASKQPLTGPSVRRLAAAHDARHAQNVCRYVERSRA